MHTHKSRDTSRAPELFKYVQYSIATDGIQNSLFPNGFNEESKDFLSEWEDPFPFKAEDFKDDILKITVYGPFVKAKSPRPD